MLRCDRAMGLSTPGSYRRHAGCALQPAGWVRSAGCVAGSGSHCWPITRVSSNARGERGDGSAGRGTHRSEKPNVRSGQAVIDRFMGVVSTLFAALADRCRCLPFGTHREVLHTVLIIGSRPAGEHAVGLEPEELRPSRPDATGSRSEAAAAEHLGFSLPNRRTSSLIRGSRGGRPGRRERPRRRPAKSSRCHRVSVSGCTRKPAHRSRVSRRLAAARNARSAVVKRGPTPPRPRTFS